MFTCCLVTNEDFRSTRPRRTKHFSDSMNGYPSPPSKRVFVGPTWEEWTPPTKFALPREYIEPSSTSPSPRPIDLEYHKSTPHHSPYEDIQLPLFGPRYGISAVNLTEDFAPQQLTAVMQAEAFNPYEDMLREVDADFQRAFLGSLQTAKNTEEVVTDL